MVASIVSRHHRVSLNQLVQFGPILITTELAFVRNSIFLYLRNLKEFVTASVNHIVIQQPQIMPKIGTLYEQSEHTMFGQQLLF